MKTGPCDDVGRRLDAALRGHLDGITATKDLADGALTRAARMRRRRRVGVTAASVVATLAVASPLAWSHLRQPDRTPVPGTTSSGTTSGSWTRPAGPTASRSATPDASSLPGSVQPPPTHTLGAPEHEVTLRPDGPPGAPDVVHLHGTTVHAGARSTRLVLPDGAPLVLRAVFADGTSLASVLNDQGSWDLAWFGTDGHEIARETDAMMAVLDSDLSRVAWVDGADRVHLSDSRGGQVAAWPKSGLFPTGVAGDRVYANDTSRSGFVLDASDGSVTAHHEGEFGPVHAGRGLGIVRHVSDSAPPCFRLIELETAVVRWTACGDLFPTGGFSPDGRFLVAGLQGDGGSPHDVSVLRVADAAVVLHVASNAGLLSLDGQAINQSGTAITLVATSTGDVPAATRQWLARCPLDGTTCTVVGRDEAAPLDSVGNPAPVWAVVPGGF
jgi:hypothetical protein